MLQKLFIVALLMTGLFADGFPTERGSVLSSSGNRYVFGQISLARKDQYMLDTKTGRLYQLEINKKGLPLLDPVLYVDYKYDKNHKLKETYSDYPKK